MNDYDWVKNKLPRKRKRSTVESIDKTIRQCLNDGFTKEDTLAYLRLTEEVNPKLPEDYACRLMREIAKKYRAPKFY